VREYVETAIDGFISEVKPSFENTGIDYHIAVADRHVTQEHMDINRGYLTMKGYEIFPFPSAIVTDLAVVVSRLKGSSRHGLIRSSRASRIKSEHGLSG
jgi:hypothetical protein